MSNGDSLYRTLNLGVLVEAVLVFVTVFCLKYAEFIKIRIHEENAVWWTNLVLLKTIHKLIVLSIYMHYEDYHMNPSASICSVLRFSPSNMCFHFTSPDCLCVYFYDLIFLNFQLSFISHLSVPQFEASSSQTCHLIVRG